MLTRATLPQEFYDTNSDRLLLTPEPQYLHGRMFRSALAAALNPDAMLGISLAGRQFGGSGAQYQTDPEASRLMLSEDLIASTMIVVPELGKAPGHTVRLNRPSFANTAYTEASREIPAGSTISTTAVDVQSEQVSVTLKRYGGPVASESSGVRPLAVDRFDASVAQHRPAQIVGVNLKRDFDRTTDHFTVKLLDQAGTIVRPSGMTSDNSSAVAGDFPMSYSLAASLNRQMDEANVPRFADGKRALVLTPKQKEQMSQDGQFSRLSELHPLYNALYAGTYWRTVGDFHVFSSNTLTTVANTNSIPIHYAQAFGPGCIGAGIGDMPRVANHTNDNYGETAYVIWLMYAGMAVLDSRFIFRATTS